MITRPAWAKGAIPTERGWVRGREILKLRKHTKEEVAEWMVANGDAPVEAIVESVVPKAPRKKKEKTVKEETGAVSLTEAPVSHKTVGDMTLTEAEALSNQFGIKIEADNNKTLTESSSED